MAPCRNNLLGKCTFTDEICWWNHGEVSEKRSESVVCYICNETFETKTKMMLHRKIDHFNVVRICNNYLKNNCMFQSKSCWFLHDEQSLESEEQFEKEDEKEDEEITTNKTESDSVFQRVFRNMKPPIGRKTKQKLD